jgi:uncharacterized protein YukE
VSSVWLPEVVGDPAGMRALAAALRGDANAIGRLAGELDGEARGMVFEGPAADAFRADVSGWTGNLRGVAADLLGTASLLETSATQVEAEQRDRERRLQQMREEAARQAARH